MKFTPAAFRAALFATLAILPALSEAAVEKLTNPDFETFTGGLATGWNREFREGSSGTLQLGGTAPQSGAAAQQVVALAGVDEASEAYFRLHQAVDLVKGYYYEGSVWLRGEPGMLFQVALADEVNFNPHSIGARTVRLENADWKRVEVKGWAMNNKSIAPFRGLFEIRCFTPGTFSVDNASLLESPPADIDADQPAAISTPVSPFYFGMISHTGFADGWPDTLPPGLNRLWDTSQRWNLVQPTAYQSLANLPYDPRTTWRLDPLDKVSRAPLANKAAISMTLGGATPSWAAATPSSNGPYGKGSNSPPLDQADWRRYVSGIAHRYNADEPGSLGRGKIRFWEIWNEVNAGIFHNKYRDMNGMVKLASEAYPILKRADPNNVVLTPNFAGSLGLAYLDRYLAAGGGAFADAIAVHYYPGDRGMERYKNTIRNLRQVLAQHGLSNLPIWNTEFGGGASNASTEGVTARALIMNWVMGITHADYYAYENESYALAFGGSLNANGISYRETRKWLLGATVLSHKQRSDGVWIVSITRPHNYRGYILWKDEGSAANFGIPPSWGVTRKRDLAGGVGSLDGTTAVTVGAVPILLENQSPETGGNHRPTVEIIVPVRDQNARTLVFFADRKMVIQAQAEDDDGTVSRVEFYNGSVLLGQSTTAPYTYSFHPVSGNYSITARAFDNLGAHHTSDPVEVKVIAPVLHYNFNETGASAGSAASASIGTSLSLRSGTNGADLHALAAGPLGGGDNAFRAGMGGMANGDRNGWLPAGASTSAKLENLGAFTVTGWLRVNNIAGNKLGGGAVLLMAGNTMMKLSSALANSGRLDLNVNDSAGVNTPDDFISEVGSWVFFAVTYDGTMSANNVRFYRATAAVPVSATAPVVRSLNAGPLNPAYNGDLFIGNSAALTRAFGGDLDDIAVFPAVLDPLQLEVVRQNGGVPPVYVPRAVSDTAAMVEGSGSISIDVLANDANFNPAPGTSLSVGLVTGETARGSAVYDASARRIIYTPAPGYFTDPQFGGLGKAIIYFTVTDGTSSSLSSAEVTVTSSATANNLVSAGGLAGVNIGADVSGFSRVLANGDWELRGSGSGLIDETDELHYERRSEVGAFQITTRIRSLAGSAASRAGLMIREGDAEGSRFVAFAVTPTGAYELKQRIAPNAAPSITSAGSTSVSFVSPDIHNYSGAWLRLTRIGETILADVSSDGVAWTLAASATLPGLSPSVQFGLFNHSDGPTAPKARGVFSSTSMASQLNPPAPLIAYRFDEANGINGRNASPAPNAVVQASLTLRAGVSPDDNLHGVGTGPRGAGDNTFQSSTGAMANGNRNGFLPAGSSTTAHLNNLAAFTVCGWLRVNSLEGNKLGGGAVLLDVGQALLKVSSQLSASGRLDLNVNGDAGVNTPNDFIAEVGSWVFFAVSYDSASSADNVTFYRGTPSVAVTSTAPVKRTLQAGALSASHNGDLLIGNSASFARALGGELNELAIYARVLDVDEVENVRLKAFSP